MIDLPSICVLRDKKNIQQVDAKIVLLYYYAVNFYVFLAKNQFSNVFLYRKIILIKIKN